jgi:hypothetical protein
VRLYGISSLEEDSIEGDTPVFAYVACAYDAFSLSRVVWECSTKQVVNSI